MFSNSPPGRGGQNVAQLPGRVGRVAPLPGQVNVSRPNLKQAPQQRIQPQSQLQPKLSIASFSRRNQHPQNVIVDLTSNNNSNLVNNNNSSYSNLSNVQYTGERRVVKLTAEQERQQLRQWEDQRRLIEAARVKERENEIIKAQSKRPKPVVVVVKPYPFTMEQSLAFEQRNKLRNQTVDAVSLNIINRIFGNATTKVNGQIVPFTPGPVDLTCEPQLLDPNTPNSYNFWITNVSSGLIKRLTGLVVRGMYKEELTSEYMNLEMPKNGINLAIMVRDDRSIWGYITLLPNFDGLKYVLIYQLPIQLDWNDDGNEMKYQYDALKEAYNSLLNNMMLE